MAAQVALRAMSGVAKDISGEVGLVATLYGLRVGVSGLLSMMRLDSCWRMSSPRISGVCVVSQVWSWALKFLKPEQQVLIYANFLNFQMFLTHY